MLELVYAICCIAYKHSILYRNNIGVHGLHFIPRYNGISRKLYRRSEKNESSWLICHQKETNSLSVIYKPSCGTIYA